MPDRTPQLIAALLLVGACAPVGAEMAANGSGDIPESVVALAAPGQDLSTARLLPADNCYWYLHPGPVETTLVPLRAVGGGPICLQRST